MVALRYMGGGPAGALVTKNGAIMPPSKTAIQELEAAAKHKQLADAWKAYTGDWPNAITPQPGEPDVNVKTNRIAPVVDTGVDLLTGKVVTFEVLLNGKPQKDAQAALEAVWGRNDDKRMVLYAKFAQNGAVFGHCYAKIIECKPPRQPYCRIVCLNSSQVTAVTEDDDIDTVKQYAITWDAKDERGRDIKRQQLITRVDPDNDADDYDEGLDPDSTWQITNWVKGGSVSASWQQVGEPLEWLHSWAPVVDWQNLPLANSHNGTPDVTPDLIGLNSVLNFTLSNVNAIGRYHGQPWVYAAGTGLPEQMRVQPGHVIEFPSPDAKLAALEAHGDIAGLMAFAGDLRSDADEISRIPGVATGRAKDLPRVTSGIALQMLYGPALNKTIHKNRTYGEGFAETSLRALSLQGYGDGTGTDGWEVRHKWPAPLPSDDVAKAQYITALDGTGKVSAHTLLGFADLDYDTEQEYLKDEAADALKAALKGQAMLPPTAQPGDPNDPNAGEQGGQFGSSSGDGGPTPPTNHPAAIAQRQMMSALSN